jgi:uncharacterized protein YyaL (SSP411 family)
MHRNRLADETSPYLLQHAGNPVEWYAWGEEALSAARREDKPILLSVGYSACHWCHVMAHESFEDVPTAAVMNELFINIKVDREERPDLDKIYQAAQQMITQRSGGWPLTMFLTPDEQAPFFGGTYFPKEPRFGLPGFGQLLRRVAEYYHGHREEIRRQSDSLKLAFAQTAPDGAAHHGALDTAPLAAARTALEQSFDGAFGGFGQAPKFPHPGSIERCLRHWYATSASASPDLQALYMASLTLTRMAEGGIYDQLGGGFCRYSVDGYWMIPHFEKMLYDNGPLLGVYAGASLATGESLFARIVEETAAWALRDMRSPQGGFYSSLDADSQGHEGRFYVWSNTEVQGLLTEPEYQALSRRFGLDRDANFEGAWHLHAFQSLDEVASSLAITPPAAQTLIEAARTKLLAVRNARIWPARDDKILTAWNALMVKGLAIAARTTGRTDLADAAEAAVDFVRKHLWKDGRLLATYKDGRARLPAYLDDYAFLAEALLELLQTRWRSADLQWLIELVEVMLDKFADPAGGFFFTASDHEKLIHRSKTFTDESTPSGNGVAAAVLCRLGFLLADTRYLHAAELTLRAAWPQISRYPQAHMSLLNALDDFTAPVQLVIIRGGATDCRRWKEELGRLYAPRRMLFAIPDDAALPAALAAKRAAGATVAYVCSGMTCSAPITDLGQMARSLELQLATQS